jgi:hypothetical protein
LRPPIRSEAEIRARKEHKEKLQRAGALLEALPNYPNVRVEIYDCGQEIKHKIALTQRLTKERMDEVLALFDIQAGAFMRLVTSIETHKAVGVILVEFARAAWWEYSELPDDVVPPKGHEWRTQFDRAMERVNHWNIEGLRRLDATKSHGPPLSANSSETISDHLDKAALLENVSHEEQAARIGISRTTYFEVKGGRGGKKSKTKTHRYLEECFQRHTHIKRTKPD